MQQRSRASARPLVLSVGADPVFRQCVSEGLGSESCEVVERTCTTDATTFTAECRPDLVLIDAALRDAHELLRALTAESRTPVLVMTSPYGVERALAAGASDCLVTPLHAALLKARVELALRCSRAEQELARIAARDGANNEPQRHGLSAFGSFLARLETTLLASRPEKGQIAVLYIGFDLHGAGLATIDEATMQRTLQITVQRLKGSLRSRDAVGQAAREDASASATLVSDGEIAIAFDALERPQDAYKIARRLQQQLAQPIDIDGAQLTLPMSLGIAVHPEDGARAAALVESAREAMQAAREEGKGSIRFARSEMNAVIFERLSLEVHLRHALELGQLLVHYQPRVSISTGRVVSVEALVRWKHPELGLVSPAHFIPVAEESGLILPIGEWVLREACAQAKRWRDAGLPPIHVAVNVSSAQFREPDLVGVVQRALTDAGLPASALELELTESMLLQKGDATVKTLERLKALGVQLAIDDFGTGYSSLNYIKRFPVDALKIDQSFIREMMSNEQDSTLTTSIVLMGKGLNLIVVAEGVETRSQLGLLRALGCDQAQGYLFSRPVPPDEAAKHIAAGFESAVAA